MAKAYDLVAVIGKYTDRNGEEKNQYFNCGFVNKNEDGKLSVKLNGVPVGNPEWNGWLSMFEPKPKVSSGTTAGAAPSSDPSDDIPF